MKLIFKIGNPLFNVRVNASYRLLKLWNNDLQQINAPVFQYTKENRYRDYFEDKKLAKIFETSFRIAYEYNNNNSDSPKNHNQIFMRISNSLQTPTVNGIKFHNNFTQFQFGGVFDIGTMLKVKPPKANS